MELKDMMLARLDAPHYDYADLVDALRRDQVRQDMGDGAYTARLSDPLRSRNWALPSYDFGTLIEHIAVDRLDLANQLVEEMAELSDAGLLRLPYPECIFAFRFRQDHKTPLGGVAFARLAQQGSEVEAELLGRRGEDPIFTRMPFVVYVSPCADGRSVRLCGGFDLSLRSEWIPGYRPQDMDADRVWDLGNTVLIALALLNLGKEGEVYSCTEPESERFQRLNSGRARAKKPLPPVPTTRCLKVDLDAVARVTAKGPPGSRSAKKPHDRSGHWRRLRNRDKPIWISDAKVNGGGPPPQYVVQARSAPGESPSV